MRVERVELDTNTRCFHLGLALLDSDICYSHCAATWAAIVLSPGDCHIEVRWSKFTKSTSEVSSQRLRDLPAKWTRVIRNHSRTWEDTCDEEAIRRGLTMMRFALTMVQLEWVLHLTLIILSIGVGIVLIQEVNNCWNSSQKQCLCFFFCHFPCWKIVFIWETGTPCKTLVHSMIVYPYSSFRSSGCAIQFCCGKHNLM